MDKVITCFLVNIAKIVLKNTLLCFRELSVKVGNLCSWTVPNSTMIKHEMKHDCMVSSKCHHCWHPSTEMTVVWNMIVWYPISMKISRGSELGQNLPY